MINEGDRVRLMADCFCKWGDVGVPSAGDTGTVIHVDETAAEVKFDYGDPQSLWRVEHDKLQLLLNPFIKDSGDRTEFSTGAVRDMHAGKGRMDLLPWKAIMQVSKHCENGAIKYGEHNVDRGIPAHSLIDSGMRHTAKFIAGETDEDHLVAAVWNFLWLLEMRATHPELMDIPWRAENGEQEEKE
jgi:hypothetical protein